MDLVSILMDLGGVVLGVVAGVGTIFLLSVSENFYAWVRKKLNPKAIKK